MYMMYNSSMRIQITWVSCFMLLLEHLLSFKNEQFPGLCGAKDVHFSVHGFDCLFIWLEAPCSSFSSCCKFIYILISIYLHFAGHYVVICGYDADDCEFEIRDPASSRCVIFTL